MDTSPTQEQSHVLNEVVKVSQLEGAVLNQLGQSKASQDRVISGIITILTASSNQSTDILHYTLYKIAHIAVKQSSTPYFLASKHALPLARVVAMICQGNALIQKLIRAQFYLHCPLTVPNMLDCDWDHIVLLTVPSTTGACNIPVSSKMYAQACSCLSCMCFDVIPPKEGASLNYLVYEGRDKWLTRMLKIFSLYCVLMIQPEGLPVSIDTGYKWIVHLLKDAVR